MYQVCVYFYLVCALSTVVIILLRVRAHGFLKYFLKNPEFQKEKDFVNQYKRTFITGHVCFSKNFVNVEHSNM